MTRPLTKEETNEYWADRTNSVLTDGHFARFRNRWEGRLQGIGLDLYGKPLDEPTVHINRAMYPDAEVIEQEPPEDYQPPRLLRVGGDIGHRTAADLRSGPPPPQLVDEFLTAEGPTIVYAKGGTGKGMLACHFALRLVRDGHVVMVIDYEGHEREWGSRLRGLGATEEELSRVHYRAPYGSDWTAATGPLSAVALMVRADCERLGVTFIVVDSYSVATSNGDTMGGETAAREYFGALAVLGLPSLTIAHVRGDSGTFPERPFGSVFVHNLARETWAVERVNDDKAEHVDPDEIRLGPSVVNLELRNMKSNARPRQGPQFMTFEFFGDGSIEVSSNEPDRRRTFNYIKRALGGGRIRTVKEILAAIREETGKSDITDQAVRNQLTRNRDTFHEYEDEFPAKWGLVE